MTALESHIWQLLLLVQRYDSMIFTAPLCLAIQSRYKYLFI